MKFSFFDRLNFVGQSFMGSSTCTYHNVPNVITPHIFFGKFQSVFWYELNLTEKEAENESLCFHSGIPF